MERWSGKVAAVIGAGSGIGEAIVRTLAKKGVTVIGISRNETNLSRVSITTKGKVHPMKFDIKSDKQIVETFKGIESKFGRLDLLISSVDCYNDSSIIDGSTNAWREILDTNVLGLSICLREGLKIMKNHGNIGNIIVINGDLSVLGTKFLSDAKGLYETSKSAVTTIVQTLRNEISKSESKIKVTCINPGLVNTHLGLTKGSHYSVEDENIENRPLGYLSCQDVADAVIFVLSMNSNVEVEEFKLQCRDLPVTNNV